MTILVCQKRHHEPHWPWDTRHPLGGWVYCNGLPQWPYARPKPPPMAYWARRLAYEETHGTYYVESSGIRRDWVVGSAQFIARFPTHAEAIAYAQNLANERRQSVADAL